MRILVIVSESKLGAFIELGAFSTLLDRDELFFVTPPLKQPRSRALMASVPGYLGEVDLPRDVVIAYRRLEETLAAARARRAFALRANVDFLPPPRRWRARLTGLPVVNRLEQHRVLNQVAPPDALTTLVRRLKPDLVLGVWNFWANALVWDAFRAARNEGIETLLVNSNWDGVCCTGGFPITPDHLGVWGQQTVDHAVDIHGFPRERTIKLGSAGFRQYADIPEEGVPSPFDFRYVLFAGTHTPFDELEPIQRLDRLITERGLDLKLVYRPYPNRPVRRRPDFVDETQFEHVIIDPDMRDQYVQEFGRAAHKTPRRAYPAVDYFPALVSNAEFVICPLSTMLVEAAFLDRRVIVPAYDDGIKGHLPLSKAIHYELFDGIDTIEGFRIAHSATELVDAFEEFTRLPPPAPGSIRDDPVLRWWLHWDDQTYAERLAAAVEQIVLGAPREPAAMLA